MKTKQIYIFLLIIVLLGCNGCSNARTSFMSGTELQSDEISSETSFGLTYAKFSGYRKMTLSFDGPTYININANIEEGSLRFIVKNSDDEVIFDGDTSARGFDLPTEGKYTFEVQSDSTNGMYEFSW